MLKVLLIILAVLLIGVGGVGGWQYGINQYNKGYQAGYNAGYEKGYDDGYTKGYTDGYNAGYAAGKTDGYNEGYTAGKTAGYEEGKTAGYNDGYEKGKKAGYDEGYNKGYQDNVYDPTHQQMQSFLQYNATGNPANLNVVYNDPYYADTVMTNAKSQHIRCYIVLVQFTSGQYHVILAFKTTDEGIKYIEPQNDHEVTLTVNESYSEQNGFTLKSGDVIQSFTVFD